ncbi:MAG: nucleoside triphosphate pyrophosphohydrolase [Rhodospirillaceae bacterium]|jgi:nucleoside triphosphate diphosphatase|nr:nucleoside triphosphate pyrophosphohydrolase [Rhodospirillaceae bacterium]MBT5457378.1 nucleoside triphosphate pyrophosphohydrolase [Rhodospirillaceae bacterium]
MANDPHPIEKLLSIMAQLRNPEGGCPWDVEQNFSTVAPYTIEEAYEVADAIRQDDMAALKDELGDLLFQVVFHAQMAEEKKSFAFDDVVEAICDKMVRRHPHVFGGATFRSGAEQTIAWEKQKAAERADTGDNDAETSALDGVALALPALMRAEKLQKRAARVGFDWPDMKPVFDKITEEIAEVREVIAEGSDHERLTDEVGDLLFASVNLARHLKIDPEVALRHGNDKFERRFRQVETSVRDAGKSPQDCSLDELEAQWEAAKAKEPGR